MQTTLAFLSVFLVTAVLCEAQQPHSGHPNSDHGNPHYPQQQPVVIPMPQMPMTPSCGHIFPGSPEWTACFDKFHENMQNFHHQMQVHTQQMAAATMANAHAQGFQQEHQSQSTSNAGSGQYTSSASSQGYAIKTFGIPISTMKRGSTMTIKLVVGPFTGFETRTEGNEIIMEMKTKDGKKKYVSLKLPKGVTQSELQIEKTTNTVMITGPIPAKPNQQGGGGGGGGGGTSHVSSFTSGNGFHMASAGGQWNTAGIPPVAYPGVYPQMPFFGVPNFFPPMWFF